MKLAEGQSPKKPFGMITSTGIAGRGFIPAWLVGSGEKQGTK